jgi:hypothetical protein
LKVVEDNPIFYLILLFTPLEIFTQLGSRGHGERGQAGTPGGTGEKGVPSNGAGGGVDSRAADGYKDIANWEGEMVYVRLQDQQE